MGYDASCSLRFHGRTVRGTAVLETNELIFRGPTRIVIPLKEVSRATVQDGVLSLHVGPHRAELTLGAQADRWAKRIMNPPTRLDKLGVKPGMRVLARGVPEAAFEQEIEQRGATTASAARGAFDLVFLGLEDRSGLARLPSLVRLMKPAGALWVIRPKGRPAITEAETMAAGKSAGLVDVKVVSFSATHTAEKFVIPVARRRARR